MAVTLRWPWVGPSSASKGWVTMFLSFAGAPAFRCGGQDEHSRIGGCSEAANRMTNSHRSDKSNSLRSERLGATRTSHSQVILVIHLQQSRQSSLSSCWPTNANSTINSPKENTVLKPIVNATKIPANRQPIISRPGPRVRCLPFATLRPKPDEVHRTKAYQT